MNLKEYCRKIIKFKEQPMSLIQYFGLKYVLLKLLILVFSLFLLYISAKQLGVFAGILLGYVLGIVIADVRRAIMTIKIFELYKQVIDWVKVEKNSI